MFRRGTTLSEYPEVRSLRWYKGGLRTAKSALISILIPFLEALSPTFEERADPLCLGAHLCVRVLLGPSE